MCRVLAKKTRFIKEIPKWIINSKNGDSRSDYQNVKPTLTRLCYSFRILHRYKSYVNVYCFILIRKLLRKFPQNKNVQLLSEIGFIV